MTATETATPTEDPRPQEAASLAGTILDEEAAREAEVGRADDEEVIVLEDDQLVGVGDDSLSLRGVTKVGGVGTLALLSGLVIVDSFDRTAYSILAPEIQATLGVGDLVLVLIGSIGGLLAFAASIPIGYVADRVRRWSVVGVCSIVASLFAAATGLAVNGWSLFLTRVGAGAADAHAQPVHNPLLADTYPAAGRARVYGVYSGARHAGRIIGPVLIGGLALIFSGLEGWRFIFALLSIPGLLLAFAAFFMREPERGRFERAAALGPDAGVEADHLAATPAVTAATVETTTGHVIADEPEELPITIGAALARLKKIKTFYYAMAALGALGFAMAAAPIFIMLILEERFGISPAGRGVLASIGGTGAIFGAIIGGMYGDRLYRRNPALSLKLAGAGIAILGLSLPLEAYAPNITFYIVVAWLTGLATGGAFVPAFPVIAAVTPHRLRSTGFALIGLYMSLIGGVGGALIAGFLAQSLDRQLAVAIVGPAAALTGAALLFYGSRFAKEEMALAAREIIEEREEQARMRQASAGEAPLLQVRRLDYSYGPVKVLFDVNIDVKQGEVLALLGTNGAGKSTLLRAISGLGYPDRGTVRFRGRTITYSDAQTRVRLGIVQVPGGKAVFPSLTVAENLAVAAYTRIWDREAVDERATEVLEFFPVLAERAEQLAGTLSGGERQMLAICKGLMLDPDLILLDELTLGLAPVVVQEILPAVEQLKAEGKTIVIVEQSINVALSIADRAVFMEKGRVRFEGPAQDLLERDDLVRAVFLGGEGG